MKNKPRETTRRTTTTTATATTTSLQPRQTATRRIRNAGKYLRCQLVVAANNTSILTHNSSSDACLFVLVTVAVAAQSTSASTQQSRAKSAWPEIEKHAAKKTKEKQFTCERERCNRSSGTGRECGKGGRGTRQKHSKCQATKEAEAGEAEEAQRTRRQTTNAAWHFYLPPPPFHKLFVSGHKAKYVPHTHIHWHTRTRWLTKWPTGRINSCVFWPHIEERFVRFSLSLSLFSFDCISFYLIS